MVGALEDHVVSLEVSASRSFGQLPTKKPPAHTYSHAWPKADGQIGSVAFQQAGSFGGDVTPKVHCAKNDVTQPLTSKTVWTETVTCSSLACIMASSRLGVATRVFVSVLLELARLYGVVVQALGFFQVLAVFV